MELERRICAGEVRKTETNGKARYRFVASDHTYDRFRTVLMPNGWDLAQYRKNPIAFWAHESWKPPIGGNVDLSLEDSRLVASIEFADTPFAREIASLVDGGFLRAVSVGFRNLEKRAPTDEERQRFAIPADHQDAMILTRNELYEVSVVGVPGNPNALVAKLGVDAAMAEAMASRGLAIMREKIEGRADPAPAPDEAAMCPACEGSGKCTCDNCDMGEAEKKHAPAGAHELHAVATSEEIAESEKRIVDALAEQFDSFAKRFTVRLAPQRSYVEDVLGLQKKADEINRNLRG